MAKTERDTVMPRLGSRDEYMDYFEEEASGTVVSGSRLERNLVKSYLVETTRDHDASPNPAEAFAAATGLTATSLDGGELYGLSNEHGVVATMEGTDTRFPVVHSTYMTEPLDKFVKKAVRDSPWLDHVWLSGRFFDVLWDWTKRTAEPSRLAKLKFRFTGHYEQFDLIDEADPDDELGDDTEEDDAVHEVRRSVFEVSDRVAFLDERLSRLRAIYEPLQSTVRIRIPSSVRGGHEVWDYGKVTNRSVSFSEQRKIIRLVSDLYRRVTEDAEETLWYGPGAESGGLVGSPVLLEFAEPLSLPTLHTWTDRTFGNRRNRFRLGGTPMWSGKDRTRLHVYGIDRHLWQPLSLEVTPRHMLAILPRGTCGNTVNRLVTNVQQQLSPSVTAWVGEHSYEELLSAPGFPATA